MFLMKQFIFVKYFLHHIPVKLCCNTQTVIFQKLMIIDMNIFVYKNPCKHTATDTFLFSKNNEEI